jgi:radical SAM superfamily enzyme YgiQ (UPF0313 family)/Flp pilus assembly protein TadD
MRIFLCYPPLYPTNSREELAKRNDRDNSEVPIGLHILGAQMREAGHEVVLENFALVPWDTAVARVAAWNPDLFGLSCYTFHRHTVAKFTQAIRDRCPRSKIIVGGVHVSPMPEVCLEHWPWVDFIAVSESEAFFPELVRRIEHDEDVTGLQGVCHRDESGTPVFAGRAPQIQDLDSLPIAAEHWPHWIISTSRGCPFVCNFCSSPSVWGRRVRTRSPEHVVRELEILRRQGLRQVAFKDETFTFKTSRVAELCQAMIDAEVNLWWTCDTRADCLDEERFEWLRRAGCFEISLGVETGSPNLIRYYDKREKPEKVIEATRMARKFGIHVRHYYIVGAPEETNETLGHTLDLIEKSRPQRVFLAGLSVLPGTGLHQEMIAKYGWTDDVWFEREDEWVLAVPDRRWERHRNYERLRRKFHNTGQMAMVDDLLYPFTLDELQSAAARVPDAFACQYDLSQKLIEAGKDAEAAEALRAALALWPRFGKGWIDLGDCLQRLGQREEALEALEKIDAIDDEKLENRLLAKLRRAEILHTLGKGEQALLLCIQIIEEEPRAVDAHRVATGILLSTGRVREAESLGELWIRQAPEDPRALSVLAGCHFLRGAHQDSVTLFQRAHQLDPSDAEILNNLATILLKLQRVEEASHWINVCLSSHPSDEKAIKLRGICASA